MVILSGTLIVLMYAFIIINFIMLFWHPIKLIKFYLKCCIWWPIKFIFYNPFLTAGIVLVTVAFSFAKWLGIIVLCCTGLWFIEKNINFNLFCSDVKRANQLYRAKEGFIKKNEDYYNNH